MSSTAKRVSAHGHDQLVLACCERARRHRRHDRGAAGFTPTCHIEYRPSAAAVVEQLARLQVRVGMRRGAAADRLVRHGLSPLPPPPPAAAALARQAAGHALPTGRTVGALPQWPAMCTKPPSAAAVARSAAARAARAAPGFGAPASRQGSASLARVKPRRLALPSCPRPRRRLRGGADRRAG